MLISWTSRRIDAVNARVCVFVFLCCAFGTYIYIADIETWQINNLIAIKIFGDICRHKCPASQVVVRDTIKIGSLKKTPKGPPPGPCAAHSHQAHQAASNEFHAGLQFGLALWKVEAIPWVFGHCWMEIQGEKEREAGSMVKKKKIHLESRWLFFKT